MDAHEARCRVDVLRDAAVRDGAHEQRGVIPLGVEPVAAALAHDVVSLGVAGSVLHAVEMGLPGEQLRDLCLAASAVVGVDVLGPDLARLLHVAGGQVEVSYGVVRPQRIVVVYVADEEVTALARHGEDALVDGEGVVGLGLVAGRLRSLRGAARELVAVHLLVGVDDHLVLAVVGSRVDARAPVAEREGHAPARARLRHELLATVLEALCQLVLRGVR